MIVKEIPGYEGVYGASDDGSIYRLRTYGRTPKAVFRKVANRLKRGYAVAHLCSEGVRSDVPVHRAVWIAHRGEIPADLEINHINGVKTDNRLDNLELCTRRDNALHKFRVLGHRSRGRSLPGSANHAAKLTEVDIPIIRALAASGLNYREIADRYAVSAVMIGMIVRRQKWQHVA